mgnify:FL=1
MKKIDAQKLIDNKEIELYKDKPKEGEFFGYIGDINFVIPKIYNKDTKEYIDFTFSKQEENDEVFPMFFKMVSNELAMEISSGILFLYNPKVHQESDNALSTYEFEDRFIKYKNVNLAIEGSAIVPSDKFKEEYAKVIRNNLDEFNNILNKKSQEARHIFNYEMQTIIDKKNIETVKVIK